MKANPNTTVKVTSDLSLNAYLCQDPNVLNFVF